MPPAPAVSGAGCGHPSIPAIDGTGWTGFCLNLIGFSIAAGVTALIVTLLGLPNSVYGPSLTPQPGPGLVLSVVGLLLTLVSSILASAAGCMIGGLPGIGQVGCCACGPAAVPILTPQVLPGSVVVVMPTPGLVQHQQQQQWQAAQQQQWQGAQQQQQWQAAQQQQQ